MIPRNFSLLFWDVDQQKLHPEKHKQFIIERTLEKGREENIKWLFQNYQEAVVKEALKQSTNITRKTAWLWSKILNVPARKIACLKKPYHHKLSNF